MARIKPKFSIYSVLILMAIASITLAFVFRKDPISIGEQSAYCVVETVEGKWVVFRLEIINRTREPLHSFKFNFGNHDLYALSGVPQDVHQHEFVKLDADIEPGESRIVHRVFLTDWAIKSNPRVSLEAVLHDRHFMTDEVELPFVSMDIPKPFGAH